MKLYQRIFIALIDVIRPLFGMQNRGVCIYPVSCTDYAKITIKKYNFFYAIILIFIRILSCNPITAIYKKFT